MDTIISPTQGQRLTFLSKGPETLRIEAVLDPGASTPSHKHLTQTETFRVLEGELTLWSQGTKQVLGAGEEASVEPRVAHRFRNESAGPVKVEVVLEPTLRSQQLFEALFALDRAGKLNRFGAPGPFDASLLVDEYSEEFFYPAPLPPGFLRAMTRPLATLARRLGRTLP